MVEHDNAPGPALGFHERFHLRVIDPADLALVVEVADPGVVTHEPEAVALEREVIRDEAAVAQHDPARVGLPAADPRIGATGGADQRDRRVACIDEIIQRRFDGFGDSIQFGDLDHDGSFSFVRR